MVRQDPQSGTEGLATKGINYLPLVLSLSKDLFTDSYSDPVPGVSSDARRWTLSLRERLGWSCRALPIRVPGFCRENGGNGVFALFAGIGQLPGRAGQRGSISHRFMDFR